MSIKGNTYLGVRQQDVRVVVVLLCKVGAHLYEERRARVGFELKHLRDRDSVWHPAVELLQLPLQFLFRQFLHVPFIPRNALPPRATIHCSAMQILAAYFTAEELTTAGIVLLKLGFGAVLGGAIGWERELSGRPAGTRTHMLVVVGVILFAETSRLFPSEDPSRIAAQIVTGIGFLGAGTILRMGTQIRGLTTAASIWAAAAIGMAVSVGGSLLIVAPVATVLTILTLTMVERLEERFARKGARKLQVTLAALASAPQVTETLLRIAPDLRSVSFNRAGNQVVAMFHVIDAQENLPLRLAELDSVESARWID